MANKDSKHKVKMDVQLPPFHDGQVTVHCLFRTGSKEAKIQIWHTTFLRVKNDSHTSTLVHAEGIPIFPEKLEIPPHTKRVFTLIFTPLPTTVGVFDLIEEMFLDNGIEATNIRRNKSDVYSLKIR